MSEVTSLFSLVKESLTKAHPILKLIFLFFGMFTLMLFLTLLGILIAIPVFNISFNDIVHLLENKFEGATPTFIRYFQSLQSIGFFILPGFLLPVFLFNDEDNFLRSSKIPEIKKVFLLLLTLICAAPILNLVINWNSSIQFPETFSSIENTLKEMENQANNLIEQLIETHSPWQYFVNLLIIAVLPAIGEEFVFRGLIQKITSKWLRNSHIAILVTGFIFSIFHGQFYGLFPRMILGVYFGYIFFWSRNIWLAVFAHFFNNAMAYTIFLLGQKYPARFHHLTGEEGSPTIITILIAIILSSILLAISYRIMREKEPDRLNNNAFLN